MATKAQLEPIAIKVGKQYVDQDFVCFEIQHSYWAHERSSELIVKSLEHSLCFSVYRNNRQVGFARVITDFATFAYICDVLITQSCRGLGYGKHLMQAIVEFPELASVKWMLRTKDAHGLYEQFGFQAPHYPQRYMEKAW